MFKYSGLRDQAVKGCSEYRETAPWEIGWLAAVHGRIRWYSRNSNTLFRWTGAFLVYTNKANPSVRSKPASANKTTIAINIGSSEELLKD
jgi:hypothetical protein